MYEQPERKTPAAGARRPQIQLRRNRSIELDDRAKKKLADCWDENELVLLRLQREMAVEEEDELMALAYVRAITKLKDEFQAIAIEGETIKAKETRPQK